MTFALSFPFHELHVRSMQIYEKLILHLQIKIDGRTTSRSFFKYKFSKQTNLFCLKNNFIVTSRKQSCLQATQKLDRFFGARIFSYPSPTPDSIPSSSRQNLVEDLPLLRNLLTHIPRDQPQSGFFLEARERTMEKRLLSLWNIKMADVTSYQTLHFCLVSAW